MNIKSFFICIIILLAVNYQLAGAAVDGRQILKSFRSQLRYKSVLDYLLQSQDTSDIYGDVERYSQSVKIVPSNDTSAIEEFLFFQHYQLYHWASFDNSQQYFLLAELSLGSDEFPPQLQRFILLSLDTSKATVVDEFDPPRECISFAFDTLNGGRIIKVEYPTWGTGYFTKHFEIRAVVSSKFRKLFEDYSAILSSPPFSENPIRKVNNFSFIDLNKDGYVDIKEESHSELVSESWPSNLFTKGAIESVKSLKSIETLTKIFVWDKYNSVFVEWKPKKM